MYLAISDEQVKQYDEFHVPSAIPVGLLLQQIGKDLMSYNERIDVTAGTTGATTKGFGWKVPVNSVVTAAGFFVMQVQTGTGNTPTVQLYNETQGVVIGEYDNLALSGTIGDYHALTLTPANTDMAIGDVISARIVNPTATITVALIAKVQFEWNATA